MIKKLKKTLETFKYIQKSLSFIFHNLFVFKYVTLSSILIIVFVFLSFVTIVSILAPKIEALNTLLNASNEISVIIKLISVAVSSILAVGFVVATFNISSTTIISSIYANLIIRVYKRMYKEEIYSKGFIKDLKMSLVFSIKQVSLIASIFILTSILNLIPVIGNYLFIILNVFQLILISGINLFEPSLIKYELKYSDKIKFILKNYYLWPYLWVCGFMTAIPIVNILTIPVCIISSGLIAKEQFIITDKKQMTLKDE